MYYQFKKLFFKLSFSNKSSSSFINSSNNESSTHTVDLTKIENNNDISEIKEETL